MVPQTSRELLGIVRPVAGLVAGWAVIVLISEFGIKNIGYHEPFSLIWWIGTLISLTVTVIALVAIFIFVLAQGIAIGIEDNGDDERSAY